MTEKTTSWKIGLGNWLKFGLDKFYKSR